MAQVFEFASKRPLSEEEASEKEAEAVEERERVKEAREYLEALDEERALAVGEDGELDLAGIKPEKVRTVTERVVNRIIYDAVSKVYDLDERGQRALNNYLQVARVGELPRPKTGLMVGPLPSPERVKIQQEIKTKKTGLLSAVLGEEVVKALEGIKDMIEHEYYSDEWTEDVGKKMSRVKLRERNAEETLDVMAVVRSADAPSGERVKSLQEARSRKSDEQHISDLRKAIITGDPASIRGHADRDLEFLAEKERRARGELNQAAARAEMEMLSEKVAEALARTNIREVGE